MIENVQVPSHFTFIRGTLVVARKYESLACEPKLWVLAHTYCPVYWTWSFKISHYLFPLLYILKHDLTLKEERRLRVFENRILKRIFWPKIDENGDWRRLHNEELHSLNRSPNIVRVIASRRLSGQVIGQN